jgi:hypothetical protein
VILIARPLLFLAALACCAFPARGQENAADFVGPVAPTGDLEHSPSRLSDQAVPLAKVGRRPTSLLEVGNPFFVPGVIGPGVVLGTGAVWQPSLQVFGSFRSAVMDASPARDPDVHRQWASRLDLFANLQLTGTERVVVGIRPIDQHGRFAGIVDDPDGTQRNSSVDTHLEVAFFEGDLGEIFPDLDRSDAEALDYGISLGLQPVAVQGGVLVDDIITAVSVTRNSIRPQGSSNLRVTGLFGVDDVHRSQKRSDDQRARLLGVLASADLPEGTVEVDILGVFAPAKGKGNGGDSLHAGIAAIQQYGDLNTTLRFNTSMPRHGSTSAVRRGHLLTGEFSWAPEHSEDNVYVTGFIAHEQFTSASRSVDAGGPLNGLGILFSAPGIGTLDSAMDASADDCVGAAWGYQHFMDERRAQYIAEVALRQDTDNSDERAIAVGSRYQQAVGLQSLFVFDLFTGYHEDTHGFTGGRFEWQVKF